MIILSYAPVHKTTIGNSISKIKYKSIAIFFHTKPSFPNKNLINVDMDTNWNKQHMNRIIRSKPKSLCCPAHIFLRIPNCLLYGFFCFFWLFLSVGDTNTCLIMFLITLFKIDMAFMVIHHSFPLNNSLLHAIP